MWNGNLIPYREWSPTSLDSKGLCGEDNGVSDFYVAPVMRTRDSRPMEESNFASALERLGGETDKVQVHRFNHWGPGWFEIILVDNKDAEKVEGLRDIYKSLDNYPLLDEEDFSRREWEGASEYWRDMSIRERVCLCAEHGVSIFSARRDEIPDDDNGRIYEYLTRE